MRALKKKNRHVEAAEKHVGMTLLEFFNTNADNLDQQQMASALNVSRPTVNKWLQQQGFQSFIVYKRVKK